MKGNTVITTHNTFLNVLANAALLPDDFPSTILRPHERVIPNSKEQ